MKTKNGRTERVRRLNSLCHSDTFRQMERGEQHAADIPIIYVWLDDTLKTTNRSQSMAIQIQELVNGRLHTYTESDDCVDDITYDEITQRIYLIVSNKIGAKLVPVIHNFSQIETIYVYCGNQQAAESWSKPYSKVRKIFTKEKPLLDQIRADVRKYVAEDDVAPMSVFHLTEKENSLQNLSPDSAKFMWFQALMSVLLMMASHFDSKKEMVDEARMFYHGNSREQKLINRFEKEYCPERVFFWYTSNSFVYRLLNRSLRTQNIEIIYKFRFFINDLHNQIQQLYQKYLATNKETQLTVYRGQLMSIDEIRFLEKNINELISMNAFWSTSRSRAVAELFLNPDGPSPDKPSEHSVLFIIHVQDINEDTTAFAFIHEYSCNPNEHEVLFTINSVFKIESVKQKGHIYYVHLQLISRQDEKRKDLTKYLINAVGSNFPAVVFGWFLYRMGDFNRAKRYINYIIQRPLEQTEKAAAYNLLGLIYNDWKKYDKAVEYYLKAIEIYDDSERFGSPQTIAIHYNLALAHLANGDIRLADDHRRVFDKLLAGTHITNDALLSAMSADLRGKIVTASGNPVEALRNLEVSLQEKKKALPSNHPSIASTMHEIGVLHAKSGNDTKAIALLEQAIKIGEQSLSADHFDLAEYHADLGRVRYKRQEYKLALEQFQRALRIITGATQEDRDTITDLLKCIKEINDIIDPLPFE